ncbi:hypothetical protein [Hallella colorans]|nr:hypothetical protein [Hallella colorans]
MDSARVARWRSGQNGWPVWNGSRDGATNRRQGVGKHVGLAG